MFADAGSKKFAEVVNQKRSDKDEFLENILDVGILWQGGFSAQFVVRGGTKVKNNLNVQVSYC